MIYFEDYLADPKYKIVGFDVSQNTVTYYVSELNDAQKEIPEFIDGKKVSVIYHQY